MRLDPKLINSLKDSKKLSYQRVTKDDFTEMNNINMNGKKLDKEFVLDGIIYTTQKNPKSSCSFCYGRGYMGTNSKGRKIPCKCLGMIMQTGKVESPKVEIPKACESQVIRGKVETK